MVLKSLEPYSFPKGTSREEVCSRLIKPTTQAYLGNVGLLTRPLTCGIFWPNTYSTSGGKVQHCPRACCSDTILKSLEPYSFPKGTSREEVCSRLIKPTTQAYLGNVGLLTNGTIIFWRNGCIYGCVLSYSFLSSQLILTIHPTLRHLPMKRKFA
jgi:hypothetical protein